MSASPLVGKALTFDLFNPFGWSRLFELFADDKEPVAEQDLFAVGETVEAEDGDLFGAMTVLKDKGASGKRPLMVLLLIAWFAQHLEIRRLGSRRLLISLSVIGFWRWGWALWCCHNERAGRVVVLMDGDSVPVDGALRKTLVGYKTRPEKRTALKYVRQEKPQKLSRSDRLGRAHVKITQSRSIFGTASGRAEAHGEAR